MHRFLVATDLLKEERPTLPADAAKHLRVLRPEPGERIELFDGRGSWRVYESRPGDGKGAFSLSPVSVVLSLPPPAFGFTLFACVTKGSRWDWTIEKATELGVSRIVPVISDRTIVRLPKAERAAKRARWLRIAEDAARQSDAKWLPDIAEAVDFADSLSLVRATDCFIGALTEPPSPMLGEALSHHSASAERPPAVFIGPEGDFTPAELAALMEIATPTSFGSTILRAETAAIFALSVVKGLWEGRR